MNFSRLAQCAAAATLVVAMTSAGTARATPCTALGSIPVVFVENGDTQEPLLKRLGRRLIGGSLAPVRIVYKNRRTCDLAADIYAGANIVNDTIPLRYIPSFAEDAAWDPSKPSPTCEADDPGGNPIDLGIGATFLSSCANLPAKPANVVELVGPVQSYGFIVPKTSSQIAITAEEGYFAFGFPQGTGQASPWVDQALRFTRGPTASTALTCSAAIGLKATQLRGTVPPGNTSSEVLSLVKGATNAEAAIGLMGTEVYDANRGEVKLLAFKGFGQRYAYYPDSSATSFDKKNVRDGHYLPWAPTPYITRVGAGGKALSANAQRIIDLVVNAQSENGLVGIDQVIEAGLVPECAMQVQRPFDGANLSLYAPPEPCACYFEAKVPGGATKCATCTDDKACGAGKCRRGYCEAR